MKKTLSALLVAVLLLPAPSFAQSSVVDDVKKALVARGVDLNGPCGAFEITKRVAWRLRAQGAGYIRKRVEQNNCQLHGVDIIMYPDGRIVDILIGGGDVGGNTPTWDTSKAPVDPKLWEAPQDPGDAEIVPPAEPGSPIVVVPAPVNIQAILDAIKDSRDAQERIFSNTNEQLAEIRAKQDALAAQLKAHDEEPGYLKKILGNQYVQIALAGLGTYIAQHQLTK